MATYYVEMRGTCREVYEVVANNPEEAMARWEEGACVITEAVSVEPVSARLVDEDD